MIKKIMWIISFIAFIGTAIALGFLPDSIPMHYDIAGNIDRWGSKYESLIVPVTILVFSLIWTLSIRYYEKKAQKVYEEKERSEAQLSAKILGLAGIVTAVVFSVIQGFMLYGAYADAKPEAVTGTIDMGKVLCILFGLMFIAFGIIMPKIPLNGLIGVRTEWSMYNENTWKKSNRFGGVLFVAIGIFTVVMGVCMRNSFAATMLSVGLMVLASIVMMAYSYKVYIREITS